MATRRPAHIHDTARTPEVRRFTGCVAGKSTVCNPQAHGDRCIVHLCACGAQRLENATVSASEFSGWRFVPEG